MKKKEKCRLLFLCILLSFLMGCSQRQDRAGHKGLQELETVENLFTQAQKETETADEAESEATDIYARMAGLGHGMDNLLTDENGRSYLLYEGGEAQLDYHIQADGMSDTGLGMMMFVDGIPQPFYTEEEPEYAYMHRYYPKDGEAVHTTFHFVPVTGQAGDRLEVETVSMWFPDFTPDMTETFYFANFHTTSSVTSMIRYEAAPETAMADIWMDTEGRLAASEAYNEELTVEARDYALKKYGWTADDLEMKVLTMFYIDGTDMYTLENYAMNGKDSLHLRVELMGCPLAEYSVAFYLNHEPLSEDGVCAFDVKLSQGMVSVVETDIDISDLDEICVLYAVMTPKNELAMKQAGNSIRLEKTNSVALYER